MDLNQEYGDPEEWPLPSSLVPQSRKLTQITGIAPKSTILSDAQARKEINVRRAPPKQIPKRLRKEFLSGKKNATACLNEVCQGQNWTCRFVEVTPAKAFDKYGKSLFAMIAIVDGYEYTPGHAATKKHAKTAAAKKALIDILSINDDELMGRGPNYQHDTYGRAVPVPRSTITSSDSSKPESYLPLPAPVVPQKSNFLPAPSSTIITDQLGKLLVAPRVFDSVGALAEKKMKELFLNYPSIAQSCLQHPVAMFIVKKAQYEEVVAVGSGDSCYFGNEMHNNGNVLFDCHAETIARRAFRRYLMQQIKLWHKEDTSHDLCIFERQPDSAKFCLKHSVTIHLYLSKPPKGIARAPMPIISPTSTSASQLANDLSMISVFNGGESKEHLSKKSPNLGPMACMSGSDKIMKWTVCGIQGSVLSNFVAPIYLNSITLGCDEDAPIECGPMEYAIIQRIDPGVTTNLPGLYIVSPPKVDRYIRSSPRPDKNRRGGHYSVNWTIGDTGLEVVDSHTGVVDSTMSNVEGPFSRLSKAAFFHACFKLSAYTQCLFQTSSYHSAKKYDEDYNKTKAILIRYLKGLGYGQWLDRGEVDVFKP